MGRRADLSRADRARDHVAPSTYYDAIKAQRRVTAQDLREERLMVAIARVHHQNYGVYGARKVWLALNREGIEVARCAVRGARWSG